MNPNTPYERQERGPGNHLDQKCDRNGRDCVQNQFRQRGPNPKEDGRNDDGDVTTRPLRKDHDHRTENGATDLEIPPDGRLKAAPAVLFFPGPQGVRGTPWSMRSASFATTARRTPVSTRNSRRTRRSRCIAG